MSADRPSPLGRYADATDDTPLHTVKLLHVPVRVLDNARRQHEELMHEFALLGVAEDLTDDLPQRMLHLIDALGRRYATTSDAPNAEVDAAISRGDESVDLTYEVAEHVVEAADTLEALMSEADEFCAREQMLTLQRSDVVRQFASWYLEEFRRQINGEPPKPWDGPLDP